MATWLSLIRSSWRRVLLRWLAWLRSILVVLSYSCLLIQYRVNINNLKLYQQIAVYFVPILGNMVFINMTVVVVRLILFEKRIKELGDSIRLYCCLGSDLLTGWVLQRRVFYSRHDHQPGRQVRMTMWNITPVIMMLLILLIRKYRMMKTTWHLEGKIILKIWELNQETSMQGNRPYGWLVVC